MQKNSKSGRFAALLLVLCVTAALLVAMPMSAFADNWPVDVDRDDASITLNLVVSDQGKDKALSGGTVALYTVAGVEADQGYRFDVSAGQFADLDAVADIPTMSTADLNQNNAALAKTLFAAAAKLEPASTAKVENGVAAFTGLKAGLYLVAQTEASDGGWVMNPCIISIPDDAGSYTISAAPKAGVATPPPTPTPAPTPTPTQPPKLPQTGQLWWPVPVLVCLGLLLIVFGVSKRRHGTSD